MIKESEIVTKKYLSEKLSKELTKSQTSMKRYYNDQIKIHTEDMKLYYDTNTKIVVKDLKRHSNEQLKWHTSALIEGIRDEMRAYKDMTRAFMEKLDNHEDRITVLETHRM